MKHNKSILAMLLALVLLLTGCGIGSPAETTEPAPTEPPLVVAAAYLEELPEIWDSSAEQTDAVKFLRELTMSGLYDLSADGSEIIPLLASALPVDVTAEYAGTYHVPADAARGYAFRIDLTESACREDGTPITAGDWLAELMDLSIFAAAEAPAANVVSLMEAGFASVAEAQAAGITEFYLDIGTFWGMGDGWASIQDRTRLRDYAMPAGLNEMFVSPAYLYETYLAEGAAYAYLQSEFVGICTDAVENPAGLLKTGDHQITLILAQPTTADALALKLADCLLPAGPYRVVSAGGELIQLERNPYWQQEGQEDSADILKIYRGLNPGL